MFYYTKKEKWEEKNEKQYVTRTIKWKKENENVENDIRFVFCFEGGNAGLKGL